MGKTLVAYHSPCYDGMTAAWAAWKKLGDTAEYIPAKHGDDLPDLEGVDLFYWLDYTYHPANKKKLGKYLDLNVQIIDHHKTGVENWSDLPGSIFDMDHSGARLAWDFFHPGVTVPKLVDYIEDRDMWWWKLYSSREVSDWISVLPLTFVYWDFAHIMLEDSFDEVVQNGRLLGQMNKQIVEDILVQNARCCEQIGGYSVPIVNCPKRFGSDVAMALLELYPDAKFSAYYFDTDRGLTEYGLRSRGDFDVAEVAKKYGGGGHAKAAGFRTGRGASLDLKHYEGAITLE